MLPLLRLVPEYRQRVWGGQRLRAAQPPIGEAWIVHEDDVVDGGPMDGRSLKDLSDVYRETLLGTVPVANTGNRFPLLIKLLDCAQWLSVQVHPDNRLAEEMEGPGHFGKTEAWYFLHADPGAEVIAGVKPEVTGEGLAQAIRSGQVKDVSEFVPIRTGDAIFTPARTMHALGPGLFLYEVQQTSDITYRVWDWDRPASDGREVHVEQSVKVTDPKGRAEHFDAVPYAYGRHAILSCPYFALARYDAGKEPLEVDTRKESFHVVTGISGAVAVITDGQQATLGPNETLVVPAATGRYEIVASSQGQALVASVPPA